MEDAALMSEEGFALANSFLYVLARSNWKKEEIANLVTKKCNCPDKRHLYCIRVYN